MDTLFGDIFSTTPITKLSRYEFGIQSDLNYLVWGYTRSHLQLQHTKSVKMSQDIILLCSEYTGSFINSDILTGNMNVYLIELLEARCVRCALSRKIYNAQKCGFSTKSFYETFKHHYDSNTKAKVGSVLIIQSQQGNIFGGYTKTKWEINSSSYDQFAFLFMLYQKNGSQNMDNEEYKFSFQAHQKLESNIKAETYGIATSAASEMFAVCHPKHYESDYLFFWGSPTSLYLMQNSNNTDGNFVEDGGYSIPDCQTRRHFKVNNFEIFELA
eukprot:106585_1